MTRPGICVNPRGKWAACAVFRRRHETRREKDVLDKKGEDVHIEHVQPLPGAKKLMSDLGVAVRVRRRRPPLGERAAPQSWKK